MILVSLGTKFLLKETNPQAVGDKTRKTKYIWNIVRDAKESNGVFNRWIINVWIIKKTDIKKSMVFLLLFNNIFAGFSYNLSSKMSFLIAAVSLSIAFLLSLFNLF